MAACQPMKPESCSRVLSGEGFQIRCYGPAQTGGPDNIACRNCRHGNSWRSRKLLISIAPVPRGPAPSQAALLLTPLGFLQLCTHQFHPVHHHLPTPHTAPQKILYRMPPKNGPPENGCCSNMEDCDCICLHDLEGIPDQDGRASSATSSPPPPPPLQPPPTPAPSQSRFRHIICLPPAVPMEEKDTSSHWDPLGRHASAPNRDDSPPPRPPKPPPRDMSRSPRRPRTRSRSRSPTPLVRAGRRHSRDDDSVTEAARLVVNRVWRHAERDRRALEEKWEHQARKLIAKFQIGHKQGVVAAQRLHNSYVLPQNLSQTFFAGFLACLVGVLTGLLIMWNVRGSF